MLELGSFTPTGSHPPVRMPNGVTQLGRLTTTSEQEDEAVAWILKEMGKAKQAEARAQVEWSRGAATFIVIRGHHERVEGKEKFWVEDERLHYELNGAEIHEDRAARARRLQAEVAELADKGML